MAMLTTDEVSELLRVSKATVSRLLRSRALPHYKLAQRVLVSQEQLQKFLSAHEVA